MTTLNDSLGKSKGISHWRLQFIARLSIIISLVKLFDEKDTLRRFTFTLTYFILYGQLLIILLPRISLFFFVIYSKFMLHNLHF